MKIGHWLTQWERQTWPSGLVAGALVVFGVVADGAGSFLAAGGLYATAIAVSAAGRHGPPLFAASIVTSGMILIGGLRAPGGGWVERAILCMAIWAAVLVTRGLRRADLAAEQGRGPLPEPRQHIRLLLDSTAEAIYGLDLDGNCTFCNAACARMLKYDRPDELIGLNMHELIHHTRRDGTPLPREECRIYQAFERNERCHVDDEVFWRPDGSWFEVEYWSYPILREGQAVGSVVTFLDVTERNATVRALAQRTHAIETVNRINLSLAGNLAVDALIQEVTEAGTDLTGAEMGAFFHGVGQAGEGYELYSLAGVSRQQFASVPMPRMTELLAPTFRGEGVVRLGDVTRDPRFGRSEPFRGLPPGHPGLRSYLAVPVRGSAGEALGGLLFGHSRADVFGAEAEAVVKGIAAQTAVALQNAQNYGKLRQELEVRQNVESALRASQERLEDADRRKDEFLAVLAHELRNPLAPIRSDLELIDQLPGESPALQDYAKRIRRQLEQLSRLTDDLLDIARLNHGKIRVRRAPIRLRDVLRDALETKRFRFEARSQNLSTSLPAEDVWIDGDRARLIQVFVNLLANASKYTEHGGRIFLDSEVGDREVIVRVRDEGSGIAPEFLPRMFDSFAQHRQNPHEMEEGLGLGLALVKRMVELHEGTVCARSEGEGLGSEFEVRLPRIDEPRTAPALPKRAVRRGDQAVAKRRVLVVDDHDDARESLVTWVQMKGHEVESASDGPSALQRVASFRPDVVILDIGLPGLDGFEVARQIRESTGEDSPLLIAASGYGQPEDRRRASEAGFDAHLLKPVDLRKLGKFLASAKGEPRC